MKKLVFIGSSITALLTPIQAFAQSTINVTPPTGQGYRSLGDFITKALSLSFLFALLIVLVMLIWGAYEWIVSGGEKEAVGKARGRIINALIGLAVLSIAYALTRVAGTFLGFDINSIIIPSPDRGTPPANQL